MLNAILPNKGHKLASKNPTRVDAFKNIILHVYISMIVVGRKIIHVELIFIRIFEIKAIIFYWEDVTIIYATNYINKQMFSMTAYQDIFDMQDTTDSMGIILRCVRSYYAVKIFIEKESLNFGVETSYELWCDVAHIETNEIYPDINTQWVSDKRKEVTHKLHDHYVSDIDIHDVCCNGGLKGMLLK